MEDSPSGLWRTPGTRVGFTPSGVQIPHPPPAKPLGFLIRQKLRGFCVPDLDTVQGVMDCGGLITLISLMWNLSSNTRVPSAMKPCLV